MVDVGLPDPVSGRIVFDGLAGTRTDSFPSLGVTNGAPTGAGATNTLVLTWPDARNGLNHEQALVQTSTNQGLTWSAPVNAAEAGNRPDNPAVAISRTGTDLSAPMLASSKSGAGPNRAKTAVSIAMIYPRGYNRGCPSESGRAGRRE